MKFKYNHILFTILILFFIYSGCNKNSDKTGSIDTTQNNADSVTHQVNISDSSKNTFNDSLLIKKEKNTADSLNSLLKKRKNNSLNAIRENEVKLAAYYFHLTARCVTCRDIEAYSIEAINEWEEKNRMDVKWNELNIEDSLNEHYVNEYKLEFSSLIIEKSVGGKKVKWNNLEQTWKIVNDKSSFLKYINFELNQFIKE